MTLPPPWSGLQPLDAGVLLLAFAAFVGHALWRKPWRKNDQASPLGSIKTSLLWPLAGIALGALASVYAAQRIGAAVGWSDLVVGLFVIGLLCALPESYSAFRFARDRKPTLAVSGATADGIVSLSIALIPPALIGTAVGNMSIYVLDIGFLVVVLSLYVMLNHRRRGQELTPGLVSVFLTLYAGYLATTVWILA